MIKVLKGFYDLKEGVFRSVDQEFEATKERFDEINEALPGFVEWSEKQRRPKSPLNFLYF